MGLNFRFKIDDTLPSRHVFISGSTGSGKSTVIKNDKDINENNRVVIWDTDGSHEVKKGNRFTSLKEFKSHLIKALASGKPFRLSVGKANTVQNFQGFCAIIVRMASSDTPLNVMIEEVQQVTSSIDAKGYWSDLLLRSRKYGVRLVVVSSKPQRCDKDTISSCKIKIACALDMHNDRVRMAQDMDGITYEDLRLMGTKNVDKKMMHWYRAYGGESKLVCHKF